MIEPYPSKTIVAGNKWELKPRGNSYSSKIRRRKRFYCLLFLLPQIIITMIFTYYPVILNVIYSMYNWIGFGALDEFIGLKNYWDILNDPVFWNAIQNTFKYALGVILIQIPLALFIAILLNDSKLRGSNLYRIGYFIPSITISAVIGSVMTWIFSPFNGVFNTILINLGLISRPIEWLGRVDLALFVVIAVGIWKTLGVTMVYWLTGLQSIPDELYQAAKIDGAGWWGCFRYITLPLISQVGLVIFIVCLRGAFTAFDLIMTMTGGGPGVSTQTVDVFIYRYAFAGTLGQTRMGYASAASVLFSFGVILIGVLLYSFRKKVSR